MLVFIATNGMCYSSRGNHSNALHFHCERQKVLCFIMHALVIDAICNKSPFEIRKELKRVAAREATPNKRGTATFFFLGDKI